ncbi:MAG: hypothetical protein DRR08_20355 [Candidatus Parabeggiatoa sp. nov. 2]|nr:MAG: hypothetical protein DRR08_20355 [Gammaproteobacteria bacterium]
MIHIEFLLEEPSAEAALQVLVPKLLPFGATFACHVMGGKKTLLKELPARLRGYSRSRTHITRVTSKAKALDSNKALDSKL